MGIVRTWAAALALASVAAAGPAAADPTTRPEGPPLDGFTIGHVPAEAGPDVSDTAYEWNGVSFTARVWERALDTGGHRVDMQVIVLRGPVLDSLPGLCAFLAEYHERDPAAWDLSPYDHAGSPGHAGPAEVFWLSEPGVAVEVRDPRGVIGREGLITAADAVSAAR